MQINDQNFVKYKETKAFNNNASDLLLESGRLPEFLKHIGLKLFDSKDRIEFVCPVCGDRTAYIWYGAKTPIGWACRGSEHPEIKYKTLMGLTRVAMQCSFGEVYKIIAGFLGYSNPYQVTNLRAGEPKTATIPTNATPTDGL